MFSCQSLINHEFKLQAVFPCQEQRYPRRLPAQWISFLVRFSTPREIFNVNMPVAHVTSIFRLIRTINGFSDIYTQIIIIITLWHNMLCSRVRDTFLWVVVEPSDAYLVSLSNALDTHLYSYYWKWISVSVNKVFRHCAKAKVHLYSARVLLHSRNMLVQLVFRSFFRRLGGWLAWCMRSFCWTTPPATRPAPLRQMDMGSLQRSHMCDPPPRFESLGTNLWFLVSGITRKNVQFPFL